MCDVTLSEGFASRGECILLLNVARQVPLGRERKDLMYKLHAASIAFATPPHRLSGSSKVPRSAAAGNRSGVVTHSPAAARLSAISQPGAFSLSLSLAL